MNDDIISVLWSVGKAQAIAVGLIVASFIIEKATGLRFFINHYFYWEKSQRNADIVTSRDTVYYFILMVIVFIYDVYYGAVELNFVTLLSACITIFVLATIFNRVHVKYQNVNPDKKDDDIW